MAESSLLTPVPPGGAVRFRLVGEAGLTSTSWIVWTTRRTDDVYVAGRQSAGWTKVSLHASGVWQHGVVKERTTELGVHPDDRLFSRWTHHPERATGWTLAVLIVVPHGELRAPHKPPEATKIREIPAPGRGERSLSRSGWKLPGQTQSCGSTMQSRSGYCSRQVAVVSGSWPAPRTCHGIRARDA